MISQRHESRSASSERHLEPIHNHLDIFSDDFVYFFRVLSVSFVTLSPQVSSYEGPRFREENVPRLPGDSSRRSRSCHLQDS